MRSYFCSIHFYSFVSIVRFKSLINSKNHDHQFNLLSHRSSCCIFFSLINSYSLRIIIQIFNTMDNTQQLPYVLYCTDSYFLLKTNTPIFPQTNCIQINRLTSKITVLTQAKFDEELKNLQKKVRENLFLVMGILIVNQQPYLCIVKQAAITATLNESKILCITDVSFIPFKHKFLYRSIDQSENDKIIKQLQEGIINDHFYFCYHMDLTLSYQKQLQKRPTQSKYFWNESMLQIFRKNKLPQCWRLPVIQGYIKDLLSSNKYFQFYYCTISRRSKYMSGTRFNSRGLDNNCNASNFVQTEEIFQVHNYIFSHISIRGSAPIFWSQAQFGSTITYQNSEQENMHAIQQHYQFLKKQYQANVVTVNLLSHVKSPEKELKKKMEFYLKKTLASELYACYDLNQDIKDKEHPTKLIDSFIHYHAKDLFPAQNFLCFEPKNSTVHRQQVSVPRINCLDCIDRTNFLMSRLSLLYLKQVALFLNQQIQAEDKSLNLDKEYIEKIVQIWAQLGDRISMIYCGTSSIATHLTKQQKNTFLSFLKGGLRSLNRYYNANINDTFKQTCIDFLLARKDQQSTTSYFDDNIYQSVDQAQFCSYSQAFIYILSWNCNTVDPSKLTNRQKQKLLNLQLDKTDIIVVCLQEMVELNSYNVLIKNNNFIVQQWKQMIEKYLNQNGNKQFVHLASSYMVGVATLVFVNQSLQSRVKHCQWLQVKTGFKNNLGNKGAILLFLQIDSSHISIINCHLAAGENFSNERQQDIQYIHNEALNQRQHRRLFDKSQFKFFIGDMNFRLELKNEIVREILYNIEKKDIAKKLTKSQMKTELQNLLDKDEYHLSNFSGALSMYNQPDIYFLPTYKFVKKAKIYDTKRTPSWCDRVLYYSQQPKKMTVLKYSDIDCYLSDHKPVCGLFKALLKLQNQEKKNKLFEEYMDQTE